MTAENVVEISDLAFSYGSREIFKSVNLNIPRGKVVGIMGASGCGKTTLMQLIGAQLRPSRGTVNVLGQDIRRLNRDGHTIVLTTHYLEEAEALCGRIAMLKQGRVVALDRTENLLQLHAGCQLVLRLGAALPAALGPKVVERRDDGSVRLALPDHAAVEGVLAVLRETHVAVLEMEILQPDLEDVFVQIMQRS